MSREGPCPSRPVRQPGQTRADREVNEPPVLCPVEETEMKSGVGASTASSPAPGRAVSAKWPSTSVHTGLGNW